MKNIWKIIIVLLLVSAVAAVVILKRVENEPLRPETVVSDSNNSLVMNVEAVEPKMLPRLVDLGADKCVPCKMMVPVLEELTKEYAGKLQVQLFDVWKSPVYANQYGVRVIPTQIFLAPDGRELFRHEGFFSKEDILAKWKKLGFDLKNSPKAVP